MPVCSCPHCGRTGIPFALTDAETVFECRGCGGWFTPVGAAVKTPPVPPAGDGAELVSVACPTCQAEMIVPRQPSGEGQCGRCGCPIGTKPAKPTRTPAASDGPYLGRAGFGGRLSAKHVLQAALRLLTPGETLRAVVKGRAAATVRRAGAQRQLGRAALQHLVANGTHHGGPFLDHFLVVTDHRVIFWARGIRTSSTQYYTYRDMTSVEHLCGGGAGGLVLSVRGKPRFFGGMHEDEAKLVAAMIDTQVAAAQPPPPESPRRDPVWALEKLAGLLDKGLITRQEFEAKKRKLLKKI